MLNNVKHMLWTAASLSLFITALALTFQGMDIADGAAEGALNTHSNMARSVYPKALDVKDEFYSGSQVIFMWRNSSRENLSVEVNGTVLPSPGLDPDPDLIVPVTEIDPAEIYSAAFEFDASGQIKKIRFRNFRKE
ncbi:hypothetical protein [Paenibacillus caui]|uniref:hypothetical protein n=1 Tax=Paenibacillus caui TaxID=2873927 RepID=UPI001CA8E7D5|nr:hypothetical protein [Paenibacillus caui]